MSPVVTLTDSPDLTAQRVIESGLSRYNAEKAGYSDSRDLAVLVFIDLVFVPDSLRDRRLGSHIMELAEEEAKRRGCCAVVLYTINFQAPRFYERHGYREFGRIDCHPPGTSRIYMTKTLDA